VTDKLKRTYPLPDVKKLIEKDQIVDPSIGVRGSANEMGFSVHEACQEILKLESGHFYKSTTENLNHKVWQDVYKKKIKGSPVYIKFKLIDNLTQFLLTSFKPDES